MRRPRGYYEPFLGAGAVLLALLGPVGPAWGMMGGKRRLAPTILGAAGLRAGLGAEQVVVSEGGPLGWAWTQLTTADSARAVAQHIRAWDGADCATLWHRLVKLPIPEDPIERAAVTIYLQAGAARGRALTVREGRWRSPGFAYVRDSAGMRAMGFTDRLAFGNLADRVEAIGAVLSRWPVRVHHGDALDAVPEGDLDGWVCYLDPPYVGTTPYGAQCSREQVVALARRLHAAGAQVLVSEAVPVAELGWAAREVTVRSERVEWLTYSHPPAWQTPVQGGLF